MKSINFKRNASVLRVMEEEKRKKRLSFNWDRLIYIVILIIAGILLCRYLYFKFFYVEASGQIIFERVNIMNTNDSRVISYQVDEGDIVKPGDSLFTFNRDLDDVGNGSSNVNVVVDQKDPEWMEREIFQIKKNIIASQSQLIENQALIEQNKKRLATVKQEVILDLTPRSKITEVESKIMSLEMDNERIVSDMALSKKFLSTLQSRPLKAKRGDHSFASSGSYNGDNGGSIRTFFSPIEGTVTKINFQPFEVALKSDIIMSIHKPENVFIKGFFDQKDLKELHEGDEVNLEFPDGTRSLGKIKRFYFATNTLPEEFQKKFEPVTRSLTADIYPQSTDDLKKWRAFYKMSVRIMKPKFGA